MEFKEYLLKRKKTTKEVIFTVLLYLAALILGIVLFVSLASFGGIGTLLAAGCFFGAYKLSSRFNCEFEYIITGEFVDIDAIYNASNRKRLISFGMGDVEIIASVNDTNYNSRLKGEYKKIVDATTGYNKAPVYFAVVEKNGKHLIKFEPPRAALDALRKYAPSKVIITE